MTPQQASEVKVVVRALSFSQSIRFYEAIGWSCITWETSMTRQQTTEVKTFVPAMKLEQSAKVYEAIGWSVNRPQCQAR